MELVARGIADGTVDATLDPRDAAWIQTVVDAVYLNADPARDPASESTRGNDGDDDG